MKNLGPGTRNSAFFLRFCPEPIGMAKQRCRGDATWGSLAAEARCIAGLLRPSVQGIFEHLTAHLSREVVGDVDKGDKLS